MDVNKYTRIDSHSESAEMESEDAILLTKDVSSLSSFGIITHCLHLLDTHFKLFVTILLLVILPTMTPWNEIWVFLRSSPNPVSADKVMANDTAAAEAKAILDDVMLNYTTATQALPMAIEKLEHRVENSTALAGPGDIWNSTGDASLTNSIPVDKVALDFSTAEARAAIEPIAIKHSTALASPNGIWNSTAAASVSQSSGGAGVGNQELDLGNLTFHWKDLDRIPGIVNVGLYWKRQIRVDWTATPIAAAKGLLTLILLKLLTLTLVSVRRSLVVYSAGRIQVGKRATFLDAVRAIRLLWKRVIGTMICLEVMELARTAFMYSPTLFFDKYEPGGSHLLYWLTFVTMLLSYSFFLWSTFAFQLVTYVPILDQACGWEAFGRGRRLLKGKKRVSVGIAVWSLIAYSIVLMAIAMAVGIVMGVIIVGNALSEGKLPELFTPDMNSKEMQGFSFYLSVLPQMAESGAALFMEMIYAVFCMSCMAFHQQSIVRSSFFQHLTKVGRDHDC